MTLIERGLKTSAVTVLFVLAPLSAALASGGAGQGEHHVNWVFAISMIFNFLGFVTILYFLLRKPLSRFFAARSDDIARRLAAADDARRAAKEKMKDYERKIDELLSTREEMLDKARDEAEYEKERILAAAREQAERIVRETERNVAVEVAKAKRQLTEQAVGEIVARAEALLSRSVTKEDSDRLADDYIEMIRGEKRA